MKTLKDFAPQTKNILRWERTQRERNIWIGIAVGLILGAILTQLGFYIGKSV